jgi:hypothetical protein
MQIAVVTAAEGDGELIVHFHADRPRLGKPQMMRVDGSASDQIGTFVRLLVDQREDQCLMSAKREFAEHIAISRMRLKQCVEHSQSPEA